MYAQGVVPTSDGGQSQGVIDPTSNEPSPRFHFEQALQQAPAAEMTALRGSPSYTAPSNTAIKAGATTETSCVSGARTAEQKSSAGA